MSSINDLNLALERERRKLERQERAVAATKAMVTTLTELIATYEEQNKKTNPKR